MGVIFWWLQWAPRSSPEVAAGRMPAVLPNGVSGGREPITGNPAALYYARAYQQGAWDDIIAMTCWMQQRLLRVHVQSGNAAAREEERGRLRNRLREWRVEENRLRPEGVEDQYVFTRQAVLEPAGVDAGHLYLEQPAEDRTWIRVTYPTRDQALRNDTGSPIRSLRVGVNVSPDGFVLKANVIGNLDIDRESIWCDWDEAGG
jgi:hypothetical protein